MIEPPRKFLAVESFTRASMVSFCLFLQQYDKVYGRRGDVLLNMTHNWQILLHGRVMDDKVIKQTVSDTIKLVAAA
jgi:hypothetical protein